MQHKETPGLGDYIEPKKDKNKERPWITQFDGLSLEKLPLEEMLADDRFWLEDMLVRRRHFIGRFTFDDDTMLSSEMEWL